MKDRSKSARWAWVCRVGALFDSVTMQGIVARRKNAVSPMGSDATRSLSARASEAHNFAVAALAVGSGLGAHYAQEHAPWVASAGVLSMALFNREVHGRELRRMYGEVSRLQQQMAEIQQQMQEDRRRTQSGLATMATISHEIRSPLAAVITLGDLLQKARLSADEHGLVRDLVDAGRMVMNVVNDSLDYAKFEAGFASGLPTDFSLRATVDRVCRQARLLAISKPGLRVEAADSDVDWVRGDEAHLQQVLVNLCANAVKFSDTGAVRVLTHAQPEPGSPRRLWLTIRVQDSGRGMTPEQQALLFQPYSQTGTLEERTAAGTGLGLYLCRRIVEMMGGTIGVESAPGRGSEFWFRIPVQPAQAPQAIAIANESTAGQTQTTPPEASSVGPSPQPSAAPLADIRVGVVDDARINREATRRIIEAHGGQCLLLESGEVLMSRAAEENLQLDVLLLDIEMPGIGGLAAAQALRRMPEYSELPIIAVSALATEEMSQALQDGLIDGYLPKPFHAKALVQKIRIHVD